MPELQHAARAQTSSTTLASRPARTAQRTAAPRVQAKLTVNQPGDAYEREADNIASQIMRMASPAAAEFPVGRACASCGEPISQQQVQRKCAACGGQLDANRIQRKCAQCEQEQDEVQRMCASCASEPHVEEAGVEDVIGRGGHPLTAAERAFFEPRFGRSFGHVRLHTDAAAAASARNLDALAYTKGPNIVFAAGQYAPGAESGRRLMAHELAHTVQQGTGGPAADAVQRACPHAPTNLGATAPDPDCDPASGAVDGAHIHFCIDSDQVTDADAGILPSIAPVLNLQSVVEVHGFASPEGPTGRETPYNLSLSCKRANAAADILAANGVPRSKLRTFKHGGTLALGTPEDNRSVRIPVAHLHTFRTSAISMLACAPCNPFTDDGLDAVTPPASESAIASFRQKHTISASVLSVDNQHIDPASPGATGSQVLGISHFCNVAGTPFLVSRSAPSGLGSAVTSPAHGEGRQWESQMSSRVGVNVPCTLLDPTGQRPGAPCGNLGPNAAIPAIASRFRFRLFADGFSESEFVPAGCTTFPFHYLYENGSLKTNSGAPVSPTVDFHTWSTSTGVSESDALIGFRALRLACCRGNTDSTLGCPCQCTNGQTELKHDSVFDDLQSELLACAGAAAGSLLRSSCPDPCAPMGTDCSTLTRPANP